MKTKFVEVSKDDPKYQTQLQICEQCCLVGSSACRHAKCKPHERCDKKAGYYVEDKEEHAEAEASLGTTKQITKEEWRKEFK